MIDSLGELNYSETADAARRVFEERATHAFPPVFIMPGEWRPELETLATELEFPIRAAAAIEQRFREIIDALGELNYFETSDAALRVFEERATHAFPPAFIMPGDWHSELETLAGELDFPIKSSAEIEKRFREIIRELGRIALG